MNPISRIARLGDLLSRSAFERKKFVPANDNPFSLEEDDEKGEEGVEEREGEEQVEDEQEKMERATKASVTVNKYFSMLNRLHIQSSAKPRTRKGTNHTSIPRIDSEFPPNDLPVQIPGNARQKGKGKARGNEPTLADIAFRAEDTQDALHESPSRHSRGKTKKVSYSEIPFRFSTHCARTARRLREFQTERDRG